MLSLLQPVADRDAALAALARTDYHQAGEHARQALDRDPGDPYALFVAAVSNERLGHTVAAAQHYRALAALGTEARTAVPEDGTEVRLVEMADRALRRMDGPPPPKPAADARAGAAMVEEVTDPPAEPDIEGLAAPVARRFHVLQRLLDERLVTPEEYRARRKANLGALLPLSHPPAPAALQRPIPPPEEIVQRLHDLRTAHESGALSARAHAVERKAILDGVMPPRAQLSTEPASPPRDVLAAAAALGRVERLHEAGLIGDDEAAREREALQAAQSEPPADDDSRQRRSALALDADGARPFPLLRPQSGDEGVAPALPRAPDPVAAAAVGPAMAVHLASYRDRDTLERGWRELRRKHPERLGALDVVVSRVDLGPEKGIFYRLKAGPLPDEVTAQELCRALQSAGQYCQTAFFASS